MLGRFLQTDPLGTVDDINLYAYVKGDPVNLVDPQGTNSLSYLLAAAQRKSPTYFCQIVECGAPHGGLYAPLCPQCNDRLKKGDGPYLLENGQKIYKPVEP